MDTMVTSDELQQAAERANLDGRPNMCHAYSVLSALRWNVMPVYPGERKTRIWELITRWDNYMQNPANLQYRKHAKDEKDLADIDLGSVYREVASAYNHLADNIRDESHETTVDR